MRPVCPHCKQEARLVDGLAIYPHRADLQELRFWSCEPCDAYVGCHRRGAKVKTLSGHRVSDGTLALGSLANAELRKIRLEAHEAFDKIWRKDDEPLVPEDRLRRTKAYAWLAGVLGVHEAECHIAMLDADRCEAAIEACTQNKRSALLYMLSTGGHQVTRSKDKM